MWQAHSIAVLLQTSHIMLYLIFICHPRVQYHCFTRLIKENNPKQTNKQKKQYIWPSVYNAPQKYTVAHFGTSWCLEGMKARWLWGGWTWQWVVSLTWQGMQFHTCAIYDITKGQFLTPCASAQIYVVVTKDERDDFFFLFTDIAKLCSAMYRY